MATKTNRPTTVTKIDFTKAEFPCFYAQEAMVGSSFFDFSFVFLNNSIKGKNPVASVTFPPAVAKQLASILQANIKRYEDAFGEIPLPPKNPVLPDTRYEGGIS